MHAILGTIASAARPLRDVLGPRRPHKECKDAGEDVCFTCRAFSFFGCKHPFLCVSPEPFLSNLLSEDPKKMLHPSCTTLLRAGTGRYERCHSITATAPLQSPFAPFSEKGPVIKGESIISREKEDSGRSGIHDQNWNRRSPAMRATVRTAISAPNPGVCTNPAPLKTTADSSDGLTVMYLLWAL